MTQIVSPSQRRVEVALGAPDYPILNAFMRSRAPWSAIIGPIGSGKTFCAVQRILLQMCEQEPNALGERRTRWLAVRNTRGEVMATTAKDFLEVFEGLGTMRYGGDEPPVFKVKCTLADGTTVISEMVFLGLDREDGVRRLRGYQITGGWCNEMKELQKPVVDMLEGRCGRYPTMVAGGATCGWSGIIGDTNAPDTDHWLYRIAEEEKPEGYDVFKQPGGVLDAGGTWIENPNAENLRNLKPGYYANMLKGKGRDFINVVLANNYAFYVDGRPVHPEYLDAMHGSREPIPADPRYPLILGQDFGRTPAMVVLQYIEHAQQWRALNELGGTDMSAAIFGPQAARWLAREYPGMRVKGWSDPAGDARGQATEDTPRQIMLASGIPLQPAPSNVAALRRAAIAGPCSRMSPFGPGFLVSPTCKMLRKGLMGGYAYRRLKLSGDERFTDEPDKNPYSHYVEACEYGMMGGGEDVTALQAPESVRSNRGPRQEYAEMD